jgi:hypothetical protein
LEAYLLEGDDKLPIRNKPDENKAVAWFDREEAVEKSREEWFKKNIYRKLNDQLKGA